MTFWKSNETELVIKDLSVYTILETQDPTYDLYWPNRMLSTRWIQEQEPKVVHLSYTQRLTYSSITSTDGETDRTKLEERIVTAPFKKLKSRNQYIVKLQETGNDAFDHLGFASSGEISPMGTLHQINAFALEQSASAESSTIFLYVQQNILWLAAAVAGFVGLIVFIVGSMFESRERKQPAAKEKRDIPSSNKTDADGTLAGDDDKTSLA